MFSSSHELKSVCGHGGGGPRSAGMDPDGKDDDADGAAFR